MDNQWNDQYYNHIVLKISQTWVRPDFVSCLLTLNCLSVIVVCQHLQAALVTMVMGLHLTTTMKSSPTLALKTKPSDKPSSEKYVLHLCLIDEMNIKANMVCNISHIYLQHHRFSPRSSWFSLCSCWSHSHLLPSSPLWMMPRILWGVIHGHTMCPMQSSLCLWSSSAVVESSAVSTPGTWLHW